MRESLEIAEALVDLFVREALHAFSAELFNVERGHHRPEDHRPAQSSFVQFFLACQIAHQPARKGIARASWIKDRFERIGRNRKVSSFSKHRSAVFSALHNQSARSPRENLARRFYQVRLA